MAAGTGSAESGSGRPRVVVLGGGFAGLGAARKLEKADVDVVLVDAHDYHTFQPLLYQLATGLIETTAVGHSLRDLFHAPGERAVHQASVSAIDLEAREVQFAEMAPLPYDYLVIGLGAGVQFFGCKGAPEHAFPMYTLDDALRLQRARPRAVGGGRPRPVARRRRRAQRRRRRRRPDGRRERRRAGRALPSDFAKDYPDTPQEQARLILVEAGPTLFPMFKPDIREYAQRELEERGVEIMLGERGRVGRRRPA